MTTRLAIRLTMALLVSMPVVASKAAETLNVARYMDVTVARLEFVLAVWDTQGRAPTAEETQVLWAQEGVSEQEYASFASRQPRAVRVYLQRHPDLQDEIDRLAGAISARMEQAETQADSQ